MNRIRTIVSSLFSLSPSRAARALALLGHIQQRELVKAKARQLRNETGLPPHPALGGLPTPVERTRYSDRVT
ncbi:MAG: hypothetical protein JWR80_9460 [Bradyrhizobium sp.]|nr:hypothetical protein [Bradyrhizobium sp.]